MSKRKKEWIDVLIEEVDYPNRAKGHELISLEKDAIDHYLELDDVYKKRPFGRAIQAKGAIPDQVYRALIKRSHGETKVVDLFDLLEPSALETPAHCLHAGRCGGCAYQTLSYETELMLKGDQIRRLYHEAGINLPISIRRSPRFNAYRNKMEYTFGDEQEGGLLTLGLHVPGHFYEILPTEECNIVPEDFNILRAASQEFFRQKGISYYHRGRKEGALRHLVIRSAMNTQQLMVNLVTTSDPLIDDALLYEFVGMLRGLDLTFSLTSVYHTINDSVGDAIVPEEVRLLWGQTQLEEELLGLHFRIGPFSFFQPNVFGAEYLYSKALEFAGDLSGKTVYDLYCGTGTLTQLLARRSQRAVGVEIVEEAVEKALETAQINHIANAQFIAADVLDELDRLAEENDKPYLIMIDPPREGINPKALEKIAKTEAEKIVYISCNPRSQVRDLLLFQERGYCVRQVQAVDQFPRTRHVETVCLMSRVKEKTV